MISRKALLGLLSAAALLGMVAHQFSQRSSEPVVLKQVSIQPFACRR
jgi:hypothetical protein